MIVVLFKKIYKMLGIDIIDLTDPLLQERTKRSLKLIQGYEDEVIDHPHLFWLLWSAKEAAFKCWREPLNFAPKSIPIKLNLVGNTISFQSKELEGKIICTENHILAICSDEIDKVDIVIFDEESKDWNGRIRELIVEFFYKKGFEYKIGSDELNLPTILPLNEPISISHHGKFGAFAYPRSILSR